MGMRLRAMSQYNKLSVFQYADFRYGLFTSIFGPVLVTWYPEPVYPDCRMQPDYKRHLTNLYHIMEI